MNNVVAAVGVDNEMVMKQISAQCCIAPILSPTFFTETSKDVFLSLA